MPNFEAHFDGCRKWGVGPDLATKVNRKIDNDPLQRGMRHRAYMHNEGDGLELALEEYKTVLNNTHDERTAIRAGGDVLRCWGDHMLEDYLTKRGRLPTEDTMIIAKILLGYSFHGKPRPPPDHIPPPVDPVPTLKVRRQTLIKILGEIRQHFSTMTAFSIPNEKRWETLKRGVLKSLDDASMADSKITEDIADLEIHELGACLVPSYPRDYMDYRKYDDPYRGIIKADANWPECLLALAKLVAKASSILSAELKNIDQQLKH